MKHFLFYINANGEGMSPSTDRVADGSVLFGTCKTLTIDLEIIRYKLLDRSHSFWANISLLSKHLYYMWRAVQSWAVQSRGWWLGRTATVTYRYRGHRLILRGQVCLSLRLITESSIISFSKRIEYHCKTSFVWLFWTCTTTTYRTEQARLLCSVRTHVDAANMCTQLVVCY